MVTKQNITTTTTKSRIIHQIKLEHDWHLPRIRYFFSLVCLRCVHFSCRVELFDFALICSYFLSVLVIFFFSQFLLHSHDIFVVAGFEIFDVLRGIFICSRIYVVLYRFFLVLFRCIFAKILKQLKFISPRFLNFDHILNTF